MGYNSIVYLALTGIDPAFMKRLYWTGRKMKQELLHITLLSIAPFIVLRTILSLGNVLNAGFDQISTCIIRRFMNQGYHRHSYLPAGMVQRQYSLSGSEDIKSFISILIFIFIPISS